MMGQEKEYSDHDDVYKNQVVYSLPTRMGNWNNDLAIEEAKANLTAYKKDHCQLLVVKTRSMLKNVLEPVTLKNAIENLLYGDAYQIVASELSNTVDKTSQTKGLYLSSVIDEKDIDRGINFMHGCQITASPGKIPCRRNTFRLMSAENKSGIVHFGEDLYIQIHSSDEDNPLFLQAEYSTIDTFGNHLFARLSSFPDVYCHFKLLHRHPRMRKDSLGSIVLPNTPIIIQHVASGRNLAAEINKWIPTFFGAECIVTCHTYRNSNKVETAENFWKIIGKREPDKGMIIRAAKGEDIPPELLE